MTLLQCKNSCVYDIYKIYIRDILLMIIICVYLCITMTTRQYIFEIKKRWILAVNNILNKHITYILIFEILSKYIKNDRTIRPMRLKMSKKCDNKKKKDNNYY